MGKWHKMGMGGEAEAALRECEDIKTLEWTIRMIGRYWWVWDKERHH